MATDNQVNINAACESGTCNVGINVPVSYSTLSLVGSNQCGDSLDEKLTVPPVTGMSSIYSVSNCAVNCKQERKIRIFY